MAALFAKRLVRTRVRASPLLRYLTSSTDEFARTLKDAARRKDADAALKLLAVQRAAGATLDGDALSASISACEARCDSAVQLLNEAEADGVKADLVAITATVRACEAAGRFDEAMALQRRLGRMMRELRGDAVKVESKEKARTKMRNSLMRKGQPVPGNLAKPLVAPTSLRRHVLRAHAEMDEIGVVPTTLSYSVLIHEYLALKNWKRAARVVKEMVAKDVKFSFSLVDRVIDAALAAEQREAAGELLSLVGPATTLTLAELTEQQQNQQNGEEGGEAAATAAMDNWSSATARRTKVWR